MTTDFLHGTETIEVDDGIRSIKTVRSSVIGLVGTAPDANEADFPLNKPVLITGPHKAARLGDKGTLKAALDGIYDQAGAVVVLVRVAVESSETATLANVVGDATRRTGVHALTASQSTLSLTPRILIATGFTHQRTGGVSGYTVDTQGQDYTTAEVELSGGGGSGAEAEAVIEGGKITAIRMVRTGTGYTAAPKVTITGDGSGATATASTGWAANPVVAELQGIANKLRAVVIADGPNISTTAAIATRQDWGSSRIYCVDPHVMVFDPATGGNIVQPPSARVAGIICRTDNTKGFWWSPSNQLMYGITGISRPIDFHLSDKTCEANILNEQAVATIVNKDGWRLWGNRSCSDDPKWAFLSVRRTADMVYDSLEEGFLWAQDRPFSAQLLEDIPNGVNAYLRSLKGKRALLGGRCWLDPELNTPESFAAGQFYADFDLEPPAPMERLTFRAHRNNGYYSDMLAEAMANIK